MTLIPRWIRAIIAIPYWVAFFWLRGDTSVSNALLIGSALVQFLLFMSEIIVLCTDIFTAHTLLSADHFASSATALFKSASTLPTSLVLTWTDSLIETPRVLLNMSEHPPHCTSNYSMIVCYCMSVPWSSQDTVLPPHLNTCSTAYSPHHVATCGPPKFCYWCDQVSAIAIPLHSPSLIQFAYTGAADTAAICLECAGSAKLHTGTELSVNRSTHPTQILVLQASTNIPQLERNHLIPSKVRLVVLHLFQHTHVLIGILAVLFDSTSQYTASHLLVLISSGDLLVLYNAYSYLDKHLWAMYEKGHQAWSFVKVSLYQLLCTCLSTPAQMCDHLLCVALVPYKMLLCLRRAECHVFEWAGTKLIANVTKLPAKTSRALQAAGSTWRDPSQLSNSVISGLCCPQADCSTRSDGFHTH